MSEEKELRKRCIKKVSVLPQDYCHEADGKIFSTILGLPEYRNAGTVFCFVGMQAGIQTASLIEKILRASRQVTIPCYAGKGMIHAHVIRGLAKLRLGTMNILGSSAEAPVLPLEELNLILLPCVNMNQSGERLGYGGGFYDRYLPETKTSRALLIQERLLLNDIPRGAYGQPVDAVIIEARILRRARSKNEGAS